MNYTPDEVLCQRIGIKPRQTRRVAAMKNVWWSFDYGRTAFGHGDLDQEDLQKIWDYLDEPENREKVFTGWHEFHGTERQFHNKALIRLSWSAGATRPYDAYLEMRMR